VLSNSPIYAQLGVSLQRLVILVKPFADQPHCVRPARVAMPNFLPRLLPSLASSLAKACRTTRVVGCWVLKTRSHSMSPSRAKYRKQHTQITHADVLIRVLACDGSMSALVFDETAQQYCIQVIVLGQRWFASQLTSLAHRDAVDLRLRAEDTIYSSGLQVNLLFLPSQRMLISSISLHRCTKVRYAVPVCAIANGRGMYEL